ncbi:MAG TPA: GAF domain-containing protein [Anaerolineales bacterium]|nr:GAF domain-containing protein [Anaerolineales bacterium]
MANNAPASPLSQPVDWRKEFVFAILRFISLFGVFLIAVSFSSASIRDRAVYISIYLVVLAVTVLRLPFQTRVYGFLLAVMSVGTYSMINFGPRTDGSLLLLACILLSSVLFENRADLVTAVIGGIVIVLVAGLHQSGLIQFDNRISGITAADWAVFIFNFAIIAVVLIVGLDQLKSRYAATVSGMRAKYEEISAEKDLLEDLVREQSGNINARTIQIRAASNALRTLSSLQHITELLDTTAQVISEEFGYYHVGLLIIDEQRKYAYLQASSSTAGAQLIGHSFHLPPDKKNPYVLAMERNRPVITSEDEPRNFAGDNNFPLTRSRMVLPLILRNEVIGLLDIHSEQTQAFGAQDAEIVQIFGDLAMVAFENIRLTNEIKSLIAQIETNSSAQTKRTWTKLTNRNRPAYQYTPAGVRPILSPDQRIESGDLHVPLILQGQKIGAIKLKRKGSSISWSERDRILVEKIADQVALALENSRLVDEAQKNALRDQMIASISTHIRETLDIDAVVRTAAAELRRVFDLKEAEIVVGPPQLESAARRISNS